jgi:hypothetical protein
MDEMACLDMICLDGQHPNILDRVGVRSFYAVSTSSVGRCVSAELSNIMESTERHNASKRRRESSALKPPLIMALVNALNLVAICGT